MTLAHNHQIVDENHQFFISIEWIIPDNIKYRIDLLYQTDVNVLTIRTILKKEFSDQVT